MTKNTNKGDDKIADVIPLKAKELAQRAAGGDKDALKALEKIVVSFERWKKSLGDQREANRKAKELEGAAQATFENAVEAGLPSHPDANDVHDKLRGVEAAWQDQKEAGAEASELRSDAADKVKKAAGKLERATQDGAQMTIPGVDE